MITACYKLLTAYTPILRCARSDLTCSYRNLRHTQVSPITQGGIQTVAPDTTAERGNVYAADQCTRGGVLVRRRRGRHPTRGLHKRGVIARVQAKLLGQPLGHLLRPAAQPPSIFRMVAIEQPTRSASSSRVKSWAARNCWSQEPKALWLLIEASGHQCLRPRPDCVSWWVSGAARVGGAPPRHSRHPRP